MNKKIEDEAPREHSAFVVWFMVKNKSQIDRHARKRLIPNRYTIDDIKSYMQERMLDILQKREAKGNPIEEPKIYFRKLVDFWCVEFQRMHGFIYSLPKRPRCPDAEKEISQYGFHYFPHGDDSDDSIAGSQMDQIAQLGYIDASLNNTEITGYRIVGEEPDELSIAWEALMSMAPIEDQDVLTYLFRYNLTVPQVSEKLGIAVSTAYQRRDRGLRAISGTLASFVDLDKSSWQILDETSQLPQEKIDIAQFFKD